MRSFAFSLLFICLILLPACTRPETIQARAGEHFSLTLAANPTTGYSWRLAKPLDEKTVKLLGSEYVPARSELVGAGGAELWTFKAVNKGASRVSLIYVRPWEKNKPPAGEKVFLIRVD